MGTDVKVCSHFFRTFYYFCTINQTQLANMGKKKVFLASSNELKEERQLFAKFIREINEVMKLQNIELEAEQWEFKEKAIQDRRIQDMYNDTLAKCEVCIVLFWTKCGKYTQEELDFAYKKFKEGLNPRKILVFFKHDSSKRRKHELIEFKNNFSNKYNENFATDYSNIDEFRYTSFLEIAKYYGSDSTQIKFNNQLIDFSKLPCFISNKVYAEVLQSYKKAATNSEKYPQDKSFKEEKDIYEAKLNDILADLIKTARMVESFKKTEYIPEDVNKAVIHFYQQCQYDEVKKTIESVANPFIIAGDIKPEFYCDRIKECESIDKHLLNEENVLLISPRRSGKTVFFRNRMRYSSSLMHSHHLVYCDLLIVRDIKEFALVLLRSVEEVFHSPKNPLQSLKNILKSLTPTISIGVDGTPVLSIGLSDINDQDPIKIIDNCFRTLEKSGKPCILCFDEFQQLNHIHSREKIEWIIVDNMNKLHNVRFVFIGCPRFYSHLPKLGINSSIIEKSTFFSFDPIRKEDYQVFAQHWFKEFSKQISTAAFSYIYDSCQKSPYYIQRVLHRLFIETKTGEICQQEKVTVVIDSMIREMAPLYKNILQTLSSSQIKVLYHFAIEGHVSDFHTFAKQLESNGIMPSKTRQCINALIEKEIISYYDDKYYIEDAFFYRYLKTQWAKYLPFN